VFSLGGTRNHEHFGRGLIKFRPSPRYVRWGKGDESLGCEPPA